MQCLHCVASVKGNDEVSVREGADGGEIRQGSEQSCTAAGILLRHKLLAVRCVSSALPVF